MTQDSDVELVQAKDFRDFIEEMREKDGILNTTVEILMERIEKVEREKFVMDVLSEDEVFRMEDPQAGARVKVDAPCFPHCYNMTGMYTPHLSGWIMKRDVDPNNMGPEDLRPGVTCMGCGYVRGIGKMKVEEDQ